MGSRYRRNIIALATGSGLGQLSVALAILMTAGSYGTVAFGILGLITSLGSPGAILLGRRYELGLPSYSDPREAAAILAHLRRVSAAAICISLLWLLLILTQNSQLHDSAIVCAFVPLAVVGTLAMDTELFQATRTKNLRSAGIARLFSGLSQALILFLGGIYYPSPVVAAASYPLSRLVGAAILLPINGLTRNTISTQSALVKHKAYVRLAVPTGFVSNFTINLPSYALTAFFGLAAGGLYFFARRIVGVPLQIIGQAISQATYGELSTADRSHIRQLLSRSDVALRRVLLGLSLAAAVGVFIPYNYILGNEWETLGLYLFPAAIIAGVQLYVSPLRHALLVLGQLMRRLQIQVVRMLICIFGTLLAYISTESAIVATWIIGAAVTCSYIYTRFSILSTVDAVIDEEKQL